MGLYIVHPKNYKSIIKIMKAVNHGEHVEDCVHDADHICLFSIGIDTYDTDEMIASVTNYLSKLKTELSSRHMSCPNFTINIEISAEDADNNPIPGFVFPRETLSLVAEMKIEMTLILTVYSQEPYTDFRSGAYFYVTNAIENMVIDFYSLTQIAGSKPSLVHKRGDSIRGHIMNFDSWGIEIATENTPIATPMASLIKRFKDAKEFGRYCQKKGYDSHVDLTRYGFPKRTDSIKISTEFFLFLHDLSVNYLDIDLMV